MPKRTDIKKVLVIGSGPIVIGQAAEFDYAGTQACIALKEEGYEVVLVNSNPATIMTDTSMADKVYMEPLTLEYIAKISNGGARDAIATLEKVASFDTNMSMEKTLQALGNYSYAMFFKLVNDIIDSNQAEVLKTINDIYKQGSDLKLFVDEFFKFCLDITKFCLFRSTDLLDIPNSQLEALNLSTNFDNAEKYYIVLVDKLMALKTKIKSDTSIKSTIEATFLNMARWE